MKTEPWSVPIAVAEVPETGRRLHLVADATARMAVADLAGVPGLPRLEAEFDLTRHGRDGLRVVGSVSATVEQTCVVTLEAMTSEVNESVDLVFLPRQSMPDGGRTEEFGLAEEPPEILRDGLVDLGLVATEFLILGIDPYPRKPGSVFSLPQAEERNENHPFAALAALKGTKGDDKKP